MNYPSFFIVIHQKGIIRKQKSTLNSEFTSFSIRNIELEDFKTKTLLKKMEETLRKFQQLSTKPCGGRGVAPSDFFLIILEKHY